MKKLKNILLIDDNEADNYLHQMTLEEVGCAEKISVLENGKKALDYLLDLKENELPFPDLIFLDINMPLLNGWEFVEAFNEFNSGLEQSIVVVMLTTSLNPDDEDKAEKNKGVNGFLNKPLTSDTIHDILSAHFPG